MKYVNFLFNLSLKLATDLTMLGLYSVGKEICQLMEKEVGQRVGCVYE